VDDKLKIEELEFLGSGWSFPITFSGANHELDVVVAAQNVNDSIDIILGTSPNERVTALKFGAGINQFMFQEMNVELKQRMKTTVEDSLLLYEPRITLNKVEVEFLDTDSGQVQIFIEYVLNSSNTRHNYVYPFNVIEGTNLNTN
jgi:phage baseplate assembly protein W